MSWLQWPNLRTSKCNTAFVVTNFSDDSVISLDIVSSTGGIAFLLYNLVVGTVDDLKRWPTELFCVCCLY